MTPGPTNIGEPLDTLEYRRVEVRVTVTVVTPSLNEQQAREDAVAHVHNTLVRESKRDGFPAIRKVNVNGARVERVDYRG
jgi:hypothetical protein